MLVCFVTIFLFVLLAAITFALMKYVDVSASPFELRSSLRFQSSEGFKAQLESDSQSGFEFDHKPAPSDERTGGQRARVIAISSDGQAGKSQVIPEILAATPTHRHSINSVGSAHFIPAECRSGSKLFARPGESESTWGYLKQSNSETYLNRLASQTGDNISGTRTRGLQVTTGGTMPRNLTASFRGKSTRQSSGKSDPQSGLASAAFARLDVDTSNSTFIQARPIEQHVIGAKELSRQPRRHLQLSPGVVQSDKQPHVNSSQSQFKGSSLLCFGAEQQVCCSNMLADPGESKANSEGLNKRSDQLTFLIEAARGSPMSENYYEVNGHNRNYQSQPIDFCCQLAQSQLDCDRLLASLADSPQLACHAAHLALIEAPPCEQPSEPGGANNAASSPSSGIGELELSQATAANPTIVNQLVKADPDNVSRCSLTRATPTSSN